MIFLFSNLDEEYKVNKTRLKEVIERSVPSHIYIMVSVTLTIEKP